MNQTSKFYAGLCESKLVKKRSVRHFASLGLLILHSKQKIDCVIDHKGSEA